MTSGGGFPSTPAERAFGASLFGLVGLAVMVSAPATVHHDAGIGLIELVEYLGILFAILC